MANGVPLAVFADHLKRLAVQSWGCARAALGLRARGPRPRRQQAAACLLRGALILPAGWGRGGRRFKSRGSARKVGSGVCAIIRLSAHRLCHAPSCDVAFAAALVGVKRQRCRCAV